MSSPWRRVEATAFVNRVEYRVQTVSGHGHSVRDVYFRPEDYIHATVRDHGDHWSWVVWKAGGRHPLASGNTKTEQTARSKAMRWIRAETNALREKYPPDPSWIVFPEGK